jgi:hypothetical protein
MTAPAAVTAGADKQLRRLRLSASQIQTFVDCPRKWAWRVIEGVEEPPNKSAELGRAVHSELEKYLTGGEIDFTSEVGYIAASGIHHLPKPGAWVADPPSEDGVAKLRWVPTPGLLVEQEFHFEGPSGHTYLGYKDLEEPGIVTDHKSTNDLKWQKTEDELRADIQATLYAVDYFRKHPEEPTVALRWVYYQTRNSKKSAVTFIHVNQAETWQRFLAIEKIAERMAAAVVPKENGEPVRALDLPANVNHCSAYGGCPHQGRCNLSPFDKMRSYMEQNKLTALLKKPAALNGGAAHAPQAVPTAAAPATPSPVANVPLAFAPGGVHHGVIPDKPAAAGAGNALLAKVRAAGAPTAAALPATPAPAPAAINPPEYQPPPAAAPAPAAAAADAVPVTVAEAQQELAASLAVGEAAGAATEKRGRGRPSKATLPATGLAAKIKTLYINCGPVGVEVVDASQLIVLAKQRVALERGLADYRFAEFGHGPGMLAVAAVNALEALPGMLHAVRLDTSTPEGSILAVELIARSEMVVR